MKISKIAKLCKETKTVITHQTPDGLWLGNGRAVYLLPAFVYLENDGIALAFGISEEKRKKYLFITAQMEAFNLQDIDEAETLCERMNFLFHDREKVIQPWQTEKGILFMDSSLLEPLKNKSEMLRIYLRRTEKGEPYFAAKIGMELYGIIMPYEMVSKQFLEKVELFSALCKVNYENACAEKSEAETEQLKLETEE